jgi:4-hydroxybutyryl-CoA dehydratase / vinylacetyl-CoA-Delta-isomerase
MAIRSVEQYKSALNDGRVIYYRGQRVADVTAHPELAVAVDHAALDYSEEAYAEKGAVVGEGEGAPYSAYYKIPRSAEDLLARSALIESSTARGATLVTLVREIGTDALFAMLRVLDGEGLDRVEAFYRHCRDADLALAVAQTDVKGHRALAPSAQVDPDMYVRVVEQRSDGIVVRGAKVHTSVSANVDEIIVLPTRAMGPDDADYALAFAVPVATPGVKLYVSSYAAGERGEFEFPISSRHKMLESLTVFDDVFVPNERVFCCRKAELAGPLALTFVEYHRFTAVSYKLPLLDALVGAAAVITEMNGIQRAGHVRDKLARLVAYAESVRAMTELAARRAHLSPEGIAYPDPMTTNIAKYTFATGYHEALEIVQDLAGGLLVTGPGDEDWASDEIRPVLEKYLVAASPARERMAMLHLISDLTARDFGGYHSVLAVHAEGSIEAEKLQLLRAYDASSSTAYARRLAGID